MSLLEGNVIMNIKNVIKCTALVFFVSGLVACSDEGDSGSGADIEFSWGESATKSYGAPYVILHIMHKSGDDIYNASCDVRAMNGSSIMDTGFAYFADGGTIRSGESAQDEAIFFNLSSQSEYDRFETSDCTWLYR